jgi:hypothetical protein
VHPFFFGPSGEAPVWFIFLFERMRLSLSPHPQNSVIPLIIPKHSLTKLAAHENLQKQCSSNSPKGFWSFSIP